MKKLPFYIAVTIAVAAVAALIMSEWKRRAEPLTSGNIGGADYAADNTSFASQSFKNLNMNTLLSPSAKNAQKEVTALQYLINAYYGGSQSIAVTGIYDSATKAAVKGIAGKPYITLYEMIYVRMMPLRGEAATLAAVKSLTRCNLRGSLDE